MNFQALLFCQDEKTARVTTQLLNELEFSVETSTEPFAAVKKLMAQHFDAVVVDCDNEQNASLLFKGARNSTLNQSSLAVAVVEGQAGVANAFRIGANLVLTKPINVEQAKGTLRVARGLLKKGGESAKAATPSPTTPSPAASIGALPVVPSGTLSTPAVYPAAPIESVSKPAFTPPPAAPLAATAVAETSTDEGDVLEIHADSAADSEEILLDALEEQAPAGQPAGKAEAKPASMIAPKEMFSRPMKETARPLTSPVLSSGGAASAPAPAKAPVAPEFEKIGDSVKAVTAPAAPAVQASPTLPAAPGLFSQSQSVPTFGGLHAEAEPSGGGSKAAIIAIIVLALAAAAYVGYKKFSGPGPSPAIQQQEPAPNQEPPLSNASPSVPSAVVTATIPKPTTSPHTGSGDTALPAARNPESTKTTDAEPEVVVTNLERQPRVVKANPSVKNKQPEEQAPSLLDAAPEDQSEISKIVTSAPVRVPTIAPAAGLLRVSQGVTQGLLLKRVQPVYPHQALQMRIGGAVQLQAVIDKEGIISSVKVLSGDPILARAAIDAVRQWRYKPYTLDGEPVDIQTQVTVNFRLP